SRPSPRLAAVAAATALVVSLFVAAPRSQARPRTIDAGSDGSFWSQTTNELRLRGTVSTLAADGDRVAFNSCNRVGAECQPGTTPRFFDGEPPDDACTNSFPSAGAFTAFAVAGDRVAYLRRSGGIQVLGELGYESADDGWQPHVAASFGRCCNGDPFGS